MPRRGTTDNTRYRKTYSFYRQEPRVDEGIARVVLVPSETIVRVGNVILSDVFSKRPLTGTTGDLFYSTDVAANFFYSGSTWRPFFGGGRLGYDPGDPSGWILSSSHGTTASLTYDRGTWLMTVPSASQASDDAGAVWLWYLSGAVGATGPTAALQIDCAPVSSNVMGFVGCLSGNLRQAIVTAAGYGPSHAQQPFGFTTTYPPLAPNPDGLSVSGSIVLGSSNEVWVRLQLTSSVNVHFTGSTGTNHGTRWVTPPSAGMMLAGPGVFYPCVGIILPQGSVGVDARVRILSYDDTNT